MDVKFSPDGRLFASGGWDGVIHLRSVEKARGGRARFHGRGRSHTWPSHPTARRLVAGGQFSTNDLASGMRATAGSCARSGRRPAIT